MLQKGVGDNIGMDAHNAQIACLPFLANEIRYSG